MAKQNDEVLLTIGKMQKALGELSKTTWQVATSPYKVRCSLLLCFVIMEIILLIYAGKSSSAIGKDILLILDKGTEQ